MWTPAARRPAANARASPVATARYPWAALIARLFLTLPLVCPRCGADMRILAFITETAPVRRILNHIGEPAEPPRISPARGRRPGTTRRSMPYRTGRPWRNRHPSTSSTRKCSGSLLPSSPPAGDAPLPAPRPR